MKPRLLDLFCGAGGASMGYYRAGFEVIGVDIKPQPHYPFEFHQADALTYPLEGYDAYHASPPCQRYTRATCKQRMIEGREYPDLISAIRNRLKMLDKPYIIENVVGSPLETTIILHGGMFKLKVIRPRLFETSFLTFQPQIERLLAYRKICGRDYYRVMSGGLWLKGEETRGSFLDWCNAMGIDWMIKNELTQAIPPAYTEYIGHYLMEAVLAFKDSKVRQERPCPL